MILSSSFTNPKTFALDNLNFPAFRLQVGLSLELNVVAFANEQIIGWAIFPNALAKLTFPQLDYMLGYLPPFLPWAEVIIPNMAPRTVNDLSTN